MAHGQQRIEHFLCATDGVDAVVKFEGGIGLTALLAFL